MYFFECTRESECLAAERALLGWAVAGCSGPRAWTAELDILGEMVCVDRLVETSAEDVDDFGAWTLSDVRRVIVGITDVVIGSVSSIDSVCTMCAVFESVGSSEEVALVWAASGDEDAGSSSIECAGFSIDTGAMASSLLRRIGCWWAGSWVKVCMCCILGNGLAAVEGTGSDEPTDPCREVVSGGW